MSICSGNLEKRDSSIDDDSSSTAMKSLSSFEPLDEELYTLNPVEKESKLHNMGFQKANFIHSEYPNLTYPWLDVFGYYLHKRHRTNEKLALIYLKHKKSIRVNPFTIIFSHGSKSTLGQIYPTLIDLCQNLKCDIISYDYSGYGKSQGYPSENEIYSDIEEVSFFANNILSIPIQTILLMGFSLGTVPTVYIGAQKEYRNIGGVVLLCPIASAYSSNNKSKSNNQKNQEVFCSRNRIHNIVCPVFLIHGHKDTTIPITHSYELAKNVSMQYSWHPKLGDHGNILSQFRLKFYRKFLRFIEYLLSLKQNNYSKLLKLNLNPNKSGNIKEIAQREENYIEQKSGYLNDECSYDQANSKARFSIKNFDNIEISECEIDKTNNDYSSSELDF